VEPRAPGERAARAGPARRRARPVPAAPPAARRIAPRTPSGRGTSAFAWTAPTRHCSLAVCSRTTALAGVLPGPVSRSTPTPIRTIAVVTESSALAEVSAMATTGTANGPTKAIMSLRNASGKPQDAPPEWWRISVPATDPSASGKIAPTPCAMRRACFGRTARLGSAVAALASIPARPPTTAGLADAPAAMPGSANRLRPVAIRQHLENAWPPLPATPSTTTFPVPSMPVIHISGSAVWVSVSIPLLRVAYADNRAPMVGSASMAPAVLAATPPVRSEQPATRAETEAKSVPTVLR
jgi:hypothetical protein